MVDLILDFGNARVKWQHPRKGAYGDFRHAIVELTSTQWEKIVGRGKAPQGFIRVNGTPYAIGDAARRYIIPERPAGAARYRRDYYGVGMAAAITEALGDTRKNLKITLMATHAPIDVRYAPDIQACALGEWFIESQYGTLKYNVKDVLTLDEPLAGYMHYTLTTKGAERRNNPLAAVTTLVIDVGGYTTDVAAIDEGGEIDQLSLGSTRTGVMNVIEQFERELKDRYMRVFQDTGDIDVRRVENALLTGVFHLSKERLDCADIAIESKAGLVNDVVQVINSAGGVANYDVFLLTGGGSAFIHNELVSALPRADFILAESDMDLMKYSNVFGAGKMLALLRNAQEA